MKKIKKLFADTRGSMMLEYGVISVLVALGTVALITAFSEDVGNKFEQLGNDIAELEGPNP